MRYKFLINALLCIFLITTSFDNLSVSNDQIKNAKSLLIDDNPEAYTGLLSGPNDVQVILSRTGTDAGQGCITFEVDINYNDGQVLTTYTFRMSDGETYLETHVQGPNPTAFAEVTAVRLINRICN